MIIKAEALDLFLAEAQRCRPNEAAGLFGGQAGVIQSYYPCANLDQSPLTYRIDPARILAVLRQMERAGEVLAAIGHSHPASEPVPSATDVKEAHYPECLYLIASLRTDEPEVRAFWIRAEGIQEEPLAVALGPSSRAR